MVWGTVQLMSLILASFGYFGNAQPVTYLHVNDLNVRHFEGTGPCGHIDAPTSNRKLYFRHLVLSERHNDVLYVGAMNRVYQLNKTSLECMNAKELIVSKQQQDMCHVQGKIKVPDCQNHIRVIMEWEPGELFVCGTGAYSPTVYRLDESSLNVTSSPTKGNGMCPYDPLDNATAVLIDNGNPGNATVPYFGTFTDFIKNSPVFHRTNFTVNGTKYSKKSTDAEDIKWLNVPQFVGSFDEGNEVYTFFRETAVEYKDSDTGGTCARVAKVCKNDLGGGFLSKKMWLSFQKARLTCSIPGPQPYLFDKLYDIYKSGDTYFALFFSEGASLNASAICVFRKLDIKTVFAGKFKYEAAKGTWKTVPDIQNPSPRLDNCTAHDLRTDKFASISKFQLMDGTVNPLYGKPIYYKHGVQFTRLAVGHEVNGSRNVYLTSDMGDIYDLFVKTYQHSNTFTVVLNAVYSIFNTPQAIRNLLMQEGVLYIGTDTSVARVDLDATCGKFSNDQIDGCIFNSRCFWCSTNNTCLPRSIGVCETGRISDSNLITYTDSVLDSLNISNEGQESKHHTAAVSGDAFLPIDTHIYRVSDVVWTKDNNETVLALRPDKFVVSKSGALIIQDVKLSDKGNYTAVKKDDGRLLAKVELDVNDPRTEKEKVDAHWRQYYTDLSTKLRRLDQCLNETMKEC